MEINLDEMNLDDLRALRTQVERAISSFETRRKRDAMAAIEKAAREHGFQLADLTGARGARARRAGGAQPPAPAGEAKYAHPDDPGQTWSGRGRRPRWVTEQIEAGRNLADMAI